MRAIDAEALKLALRKTMDACVDEDGTLLYSDHLIVDADYDEVCNVIDEQPTIQPEQRTGYWYPVGVAEVVGGETAQWGSAIAYHKCSECDGQALKDDFEQEVLSEFCPHCGAKMEGDAE